ncbi:STM3941 family protein [Brevundimonas sp.]|uniref:STM3941 family protein n=1 Tax=Brevundimonas sp. TaxID=1871086 RepID=UPI003919C1C6
MQGDTDVLVIRSLRSKALLLAFLALPMIGVCLFIALDHPQSVTRWIGWLGAAFFTLGLFAIFVRLIRPDTLILTAEGFTLRDWKQTQQIQWTDIKEFFVWSSHGSAMASWRLHESARQASLMARINRPFGLDGSIGVGWPYPPKQMADVLAEWKQRHAPESHPHQG